MSERVEKEYRVSLTRAQGAFFGLKSPNPLFVAGFGSGKTTCMLAKAFHDLVSNPGVSVALYEPTYSLLRLTLLPVIETWLGQGNVPYQVNRTENFIDCAYGKIVLRSLDRPDKIIAYEVFSSHVDEIDTLPHQKAEEAFLKILGRNRQKNKQGVTGRVYCYGTPEGFRFTHHYWGKEDRLPGYSYVRAPTRSNPHLPEAYIESLKRSYPEQLVNAYLEGRWVNMSVGSVYPEFDRHENHCDDVIVGEETLHVGQDFNVNAMASVIHVMRNGMPRAVAEVVKCRDTPHMLETIKELYSNNPIIFYPDSSGAARKSVGASKSDIKLIREAGFSVRARKRNPNVKDRVVSMNAMFRNADQERRYLVNTVNCPHYTVALETHAYDDNGVPEKTGLPDDPSHLTEAGGYFIDYKFPVRRPIITETRAVEA